MRSTPLVSVIIPTRNRPEILKVCLEHLLKQEYPTFEVIVVDNSTDKRTQDILSLFPSIQNIKISQPNLARNIGIEKSSGKILAFIDDDSIVRPGWLMNIVAGYVDDSVGGVGGRVLDKPVDILSSKEIIAKIGSDGRIIGKGLDANCSDLVEVDHLRGCNMSFLKRVLEAIGNFDSHYTYWREDTDVCLRVRRAEFRILFNPKAEVIHYAARGRSKGIFVFFDPTVQYSAGKQTGYFAIKNFGFKPRILVGQGVDSLREVIKLFICSALLFTGVFAHLAGRFVGILFGLKALLAQKFKGSSRV